MRQESYDLLFKNNLILNHNFYLGSQGDIEIVVAAGGSCDLSLAENPILVSSVATVVTNAFQKN